ncbi:MAG TPA: hypothetical protein VF976_12325 [Gemmatimonadales bacterium]
MVIPIGSQRHPACGWGGSAATMSGIGPSFRVGQPTRERAQEINITDAALAAKVAACLAGGERLEQDLRDTKVLAAKLGSLEELQSGRLAAAKRDSCLAALRQRISELARRLEHSAWTV